MIVLMDSIWKMDNVLGVAMSVVFVWAIVKIVQAALTKQGIIIMIVYVYLAIFK